MCGIAGFFTEDGISDTQKETVFKIMTKMFEETQSRGTDASGFSYINGHGELITVKAPIASKSMVKEAKWLRLKTPEHFPNHLIAHCRAMTKGDPIKNENNHPLVVNKEIALVHNGCISNDEELRKEYSLKGKGEVDSEAIPLLIKMRIGELVKDVKDIDSIKVAKAINMAAQELSGGFACAMVNRNTPKSLYLFNHKNPIVLAYCEELKTFFFASTMGIIKDGFSILPNKFLHKWFQAPKFTAEDIIADTITLIKKGDDGKVEVNFWELKVKPYTTYNQVAPKEKETITRSLKPKHGFKYAASVDDDGEAAPEPLQDWEIAAAHGGKNANLPRIVNDESMASCFMGMQGED